MASLSAATASATVRSSAWISATSSRADSRSRFRLRGFRCSVRRSSSMAGSGGRVYGLPAARAGGSKLTIRAWRRMTPTPPRNASTAHPTADPTSDLLVRARHLAPELVALRREFHRHPELSFQEHRTAARVAEALRGMGYEVRTGVARTGVVAELRVGPEGGADAGSSRTVALRADMDALPIQEANAHDFVSETPGVMHACGHDAHVAGLLGAARLLADLQREGHLPTGRVRLLFQPSEETMDAEGKSGGRRMAEEGAMAGVHAVVGLHVGAHLECGRVYLAPGPFFGGADTIHIRVEGRAAHAARPHEGVDALVLAAQGVLAAQMAVSRRIAPERRGVVSLGTIRGGVAHNIVCDRVEIEGTLRYFEPEVRAALRQAVTEAFTALETQGATVQVTFVDGYPPVVNDAATTTRVRAASARVAGAGVLMSEEASEAAMTAEDFSFLAARAPGAFFWLGAALPDAREHHHPRFDIDEEVIPLGAALLAGAAIELLNPEPR
ncbi:MAG: amidohydrolase [Gemmatimonadales bacterium]|nr:MAG: amidohydrolase [Gemmatimonadales bacterium]